VLGVNTFQSRRETSNLCADPVRAMQKKSARYYYSVWLQHLVHAHLNGVREVPRVVAELGPGNSLGISSIGLLCLPAHILTEARLEAGSNKQKVAKIKDKICAPPSNAGSDELICYVAPWNGSEVIRKHRYDSLSSCYGTCR